MNVEQRLHQAAHEIREIEVDVPTFVAPSPTPGVFRRVAPMLAVSLAMFLGLATFASRPDGASSAVTEQWADVSAQLGASDVAMPADGDRSFDPSQLTPREEVAMITSITSIRSTRSPARLGDSRVPTGAS